MRKCLSALTLVLFGAGIGIAAPLALAQTAAPAVKKSGKPASRKSATKSKPVKKSKASKADAAADMEGEPDITGSSSVDFECELGNRLTIYENASDNTHIALRWKKRLHRLRRVDTTTGAQRFENRRYGLIWIGIPAKGMLLDSKKGRQLANDCKNAEQLQQATANPKAPTLLSAPATPAPAEMPEIPAAPSKPRKPQS